MNKNVHHESSRQQVTGSAVYVNDMYDSHNMLIGKVIYSNHPHAKITKINLNGAQNIEGIHCILTAKDIPGKNQIGPVFHDEPCLAADFVECIGQAVILIAGDSGKVLHEAAKRIEIKYKALKPILTIEEAKKENSKLAPARTIERGNISEGFNGSKHIIEGSLTSGAQEHWYLEPQTALSVPQEDGDMIVYASSQNPTETQIIVAEVLGLESKNVICEVKRMGGGFGGKETQANHIAAWSALLAYQTKKPVMMQLFRDDDQKITGKRHPFQSSYKIGFNENGEILAYEVDLNADAGHAADLSMAILERAMLHAENSYFIPNIKITATAWKTNNFSNTAFRGFGGPQGMAVIEHAIDRIARFLVKDPAEIRLLNFYSQENKAITPYAQLLNNIHLQTIYEKIICSSDYHKRKKEIDIFNSSSGFIKKGIALTPVKFGISFTTSFLNQAGALVHVYKDGSVQINHGGTEMGQGLHTKILQIASSELGIPVEKIKITATNTSKVPNTSPTAASSGTDINGMAVKNAVEKIKSRLISLAVSMLKDQFASDSFCETRIIFENSYVYDQMHIDRKITFKDLISKAYLTQISLSATGFYKTPDINFDREKGTGNPFYYFSYGMAVSEVKINTLTGDCRLIRTDIIQDVGDSINTGIDLGQVTGGFIQGVGWVTTEEIKYNKEGHLITYSPDTYKIPVADDIPEIFNVELLKGVPNPFTIHSSKAVGEPPFMLAFSVWMAIRYAVSSIADHQKDPELDIPATNEMIILAIEKFKNLQNPDAETIN
jgi:xanthine dehydrogenase large subunit